MTDGEDQPLSVDTLLVHTHTHRMLVDTDDRRTG